MKTAKIGAIFLISVMALAGVGAGYAAWFDTITVEGTVNTGSVGWDITGYSGTYVWKVYNDVDPENGLECVVATDPDVTYPKDEGFRVAYSEAKQTVDEDGAAVDDSVTVVFYNLFPCIEFEADFTIEYTGSVPGKVNDIAFDLTQWNPLLTPHVTVTVNGVAFITNGVFAPIYGLGYQLHEGDLIHVVITIHIPQIDENNLPTDYLMGLTGSFDLDVQVIQWNEYPHAFIP